MEGIVTPLPSWDDWPEKAWGIFQGFRSAKGEDLIPKRSMFIEAATRLEFLTMVRSLPSRA